MIKSTRRTFAKLLITGAASVPLLPLLGKAAFAQQGHHHGHEGMGKTDAASHAAAMDKYLKKGDEVVAMLLYPQMTALDVVGPQYFFASLYGGKVHLVAKDPRKPIMSDTGLAIQPTLSMKECPKDVTVLFVPGGCHGTLAAMEDKETLDFIADRGSRAGYVTSACTGSLLLGAAGLLKGYKATSHWVTRDMLSLFEATPTDERVVVDRNRITAAGVSAGLDLGLRMTDILRGREYAEATQLLAEYDPQPHLNAGSYAKAPTEAQTLIKDMFAPFVEKAKGVGRAVYGPLTPPPSD
jgi:putative intracellular protease/amidase